MRWLIILIIMGAFIGAPSKSIAQSHYWYPWCSVDFNGFGAGHRSCYFASWQQCRATLSGIGGLCVENPANPPIGPHPAPAVRKRTRTR
jgi:hypothetical protein